MVTTWSQKSSALKVDYSQRTYTGLVPFKSSNIIPRRRIIHNETTILAPNRNLIPLNLNTAEQNIWELNRLKVTLIRKVHLLTPLNRSYLLWITDHSWLLSVGCLVLMCRYLLSRDFSEVRLLFVNPFKQGPTVLVYQEIRIPYKLELFFVGVSQVVP